MKKCIVFFATIFCLAHQTKANDVLVTSVSLINQSTSGALSTHYNNVQFSINWKNSWRTSTNESNYDGCWIFVKYRKQSTSVWLHATINASGQTVPTGSTIQPTADGKGVFMYRSADGIGDVNFLNAAIRWNYGADGVLDNENVEVKVYAVEMVYVPQSPFNLGNASNEAGKFRDGAVNTWYPITSENSITSGTLAGNLTASSNFTAGVIPAAFPKGFQAFWTMKYEFSRQQYVDFLNTLDQTSANLRNNVSAAGSVPNLTVTQPEVAASGFSPANMLAWLDWAALRPLTEFEYEKACRGGNNTPSPLEYAWGNTTLELVTGGQNIGTSTETWTNGNASLATPFAGPVIRCGALATAVSNRTQSGATFYGIMEMSGNVQELVIYAGNTDGRIFTGAHGDGILNASVQANTTGWPSTTNPSGMFARGGGYNTSSPFLQLSDRSSGPADYNTNAAGFGGRGARTGE